MDKGFGRQEPTKEEYIKFLKKVFVLIKQNNEIKIKEIFQTNFHLINEKMPNYLLSIFKHFLNIGWLEQDLINCSNNLWSYIRKYSIVNIKTSFEIQISILKKTLKYTDIKIFPAIWAMLQINLGNTYLRRIAGDRKENIETAINCCKLALKVNTRHANPLEWADIQTDLGNAYQKRIAGDRKENIETAINCCKLALEVRTLQAYPLEWSDIQRDLGSAYSQRIAGDRKENIETAINRCKLALKVNTRQAYPFMWAGIHMDLAIEYLYRIAGDRKENIEAAINCCKLALEVRTRQAHPFEWASVQINLSSAYNQRIAGDRKANIEAAIKCCELALEVFILQDYPLEWTTIQINLSSAYSQRIAGDRKKNIEAAINCCELVLTVHTRQAYPLEWAKIQMNLGNAYSQRIAGDRKENIEAAIQSYNLALKVHTRQAYSLEWAKIQMNLGNAYSQRIAGDRKENIEAAINYCKLALKVNTCQACPNNHFSTTSSIGYLFFQENRWQEAIEAYDSAIEAIELIRNNASTDDRRQEIQIDALNIYNDLIQACLNTAQIDKAIEYSERFRSRMLVDLVSGKELSSVETNPRVQELIGEFDRLQQEIDLERQFLQSNDNNLSSGRSQFRISCAQLEESSAKISQLEREKQDLLQQIRAQDPVMAGEIQVTPMNFAEIQQQIDNPQTAILSFYSTTEDIHVFIVYGDKAPEHYICQQQGYDLSNWIIQEWLQPYQTAFSQNNEALKQEWQESMPNLLQELAQKLAIDNIVAKHLTGIEELIIIPHHSLHYIPFAAIPLSAPDWEYLGDRFRIRYAPSCQILQYCQEREPVTEINYGTVEDADNSLPGARIEGHKIAQIRNIEDEYRLIGKDNCSVENYRQLSKKVRVLHSSHHAVSRLDNPLESALELADGQITLGQLLLWRRDELVEVFLSCCETNLGTVNMGDNVLTLASGFLCAGARAVISSLWVADDLAATIMSISYHRQRQKGRSRTEALQQAQQRLRKMSGEEFQSFYQQKLETYFERLWEQTYSSKEEVRKEYESLPKDSPDYKEKEAKYNRLASNLEIFENLDRRIEKLSKLSNESLPFDNPRYWSVFICSGMS